MFAIFVTVSTMYGMQTPSMADTAIVQQTVTVQPGDTLWSIASKVTPSSMDIREMVFELQRLNHIDNATTLVAGTTLTVPLIR